MLHRLDCDEPPRPDQKIRVHPLELFQGPHKASRDDQRSSEAGTNFSGQQKNLGGGGRTKGLEKVTGEQACALVA